MKPFTAILLGLLNAAVWGCSATTPRTVAPTAIYHLSPIETSAQAALIRLYLQGHKYQSVADFRPDYLVARDLLARLPASPVSPRMRLLLPVYTDLLLAYSLLDQANPCLTERTFFAFANTYPILRSEVSREHGGYDGAAVVSWLWIEAFSRWHEYAHGGPFVEQLPISLE